MTLRKAVSIAVIVIWLIIMIYLARYSLSVFNVLTYDETQLMPSNIEPVIVNNLVNKYIGTSNETTLVVVIKLSNNETSNIEDRLNYVNNVVNYVDEPGITITDLLTAYNSVYKIYNETINNVAEGIINNESSTVWSLYWSLNNECSLIMRLNREYYSMVYNISGEVSGEFNATINYAQLLYYEIENYYLRNYPNASLSTLFKLTTRNYELRYGQYDSYINELANESLIQLINRIGDNPSPYTLISENISGILFTNFENIIQREYPGIDLYNITGYVYDQLINDKVNQTNLEIAILPGPNANINLLRLLLMREYINNTPQVLAPYIYQLACNDNESIVYAVLNDLRSSVTKALTQEYPPPSILDLPDNLTQRFLNGTYTVAFITLPGNYEDEVYDLLIRKDWVYPVSTGVILYELEKMVTSDVNIIDKTTAILVFVTMIAMLGTLIGPVISLAILGLTYASSLGLLYDWAIHFKLYYLTVYMIAPIIFGIGVDYSMLMLSRYLEERIRGLSKDEALKVVLTRVRPTILTSASVVGLGLGSFAISRYGYIQDIGIGFIIAVSLTIVATAIILPEIMRVLGDGVLWPMGLRAKSVELRTAFLSRMAKFAVNRPKTIVAIFLAITALALTYLVLSIKITTDPVQVMPNTPAKVGLTLLINYFRNYDYSTAYLVVYGNKTAAIALLNAVKKQNYVINAVLTYNGSNLYIITATVNQQSLSDKLIPIYLSLKEVANEVSREYGVNVLIGGSPSYKYYFVLGFEREYYGFIIYLMITINIVILTIYMRSVMIPLRLVATVLMSITCHWH
ncbi:MMPL family transporter [Vulcanisaeta sp. JCM 16161]|uniref:MMPL family transporter n=1 Tax=Vulcanisaeta sp. JCM 16161 TaxID=1295372 RepID=UPI000AEF47A5|nr:MMPL family transporter [Vulcanisaeta sp. JCM 16161]